MKEPWPRWILNHRWGVVYLLFLLSGVLGFFATHIRFDFNFQEYFPENDPVRDAYREQLRDFPGEVSEFVVIAESTELFSQEKLEQLKMLGDILERSGDFAAVNSLMNLPREVFGPFSSTYAQICLGQELDSKAYLEFRDRSLSHPLLEELLVFQTGQVTAIRAVLVPELANDKGRERVRKRLAAALVTFQGVFDDIFYTGFSGTRADFAVTIKKEQRLLFPLVILLILIVLWLFLGRTWAIILPFLISLMAVLWTLGLMALANSPFTILSSGTPLLIMIIGISDSLHILYHLRDNLERGLPKDEAIIGTFLFLGRSCFLTSITTAVGFFALAFTNLPILKDFGLFTGIGILLNYVLLMGLLPVLLVCFPAEALNFKSYSWLEILQNKLIRQLIQFTSFPGRWLVVFVLITLVVGLGLKDVYEETRVYQGLAKRNRLYKTIQKAEAKLGGLLPFGVALRFDSDEELFSNRALRQLKAIQEFLDNRNGVVGSTFSLDNIVRFLNASNSKQGADVDLDTIPGAALRAQLLMLRHLNPGLIDSVVNLEKRALLVRGRMRDIGSIRFRPFLAELEAFLVSSTPGSWTIAGLPNLSLRLSEKVVTYILKTFFLACVVIFLGFLLGFRSIKMAVISLLPNVIPLFFILGFLGWVKIPLQPAVAIVFSIVYGIAVNNTIHFINRYLRERREGRKDCVERTIQSTGMAIISSSVVLITGFGILAYSEFLGLAYLGLLLGVGILAALGGDLLFLPLALRKFA